MMTTREVVLQNVALGAYQNKIKRFEMVELGGTNGIANGTLGRVSFNDQPQLRDQPNQIIIILNIELFLNSTYANSQFTNTLPGIPAAELPKGVLVLYINGEESVHLIPLAKLVHINDQLSPYQWDLQGFDRLSNVDWDKSYVQFSSATAGGPYVAPFGVTYLRFQVDPTTGNWIEK
jgi:hypothetical protein